ncbi:MAG: MmgE/PrpD family protein [Acidimicrobiales bacterium]
MSSASSVSASETTPAGATARTVSERLADYVVDLRFDDIPTGVVAKVKDHLVHHLGVALRGVGTDRAAQHVRLAHELSGGEGAFTIIGEPRRADLLDAIFANAISMSHAGLDDFQLPSGVHPGVVTQPIAWALGESARASGRDFLTAVIAGYDVMSKLGNVMFTWGADAPRRPNYVFAPFGGAATAARLLSLPREATAHALGHASQMGMGIVEGSAFFTSHNPLLARSAVMAALLARSGVPSGPTMIEGRHGVYRTFFQHLPETLDDHLETLGRDFEVTNAFLKRYSASGINIIPMELAQTLVDEHALSADRIASVDVILPTSRKVREAVWEEPLLSPSAARTNRQGSLRFQVSIIFSDGRVDRARYEQPPDDALLEMLRRVRLRFEDGHPRLRYARIEVTTTDGERYTSEGDTHAFPAPDSAAWLVEGGRAVLSDAQVARLVDLIAGLEDVPDVNEVLACLVPEGPSARLRS